MERKKVLALKENQVLEINLKRWRKKTFGFKGKSSFRDKPSRDGEKKSFGFKGKSSFSPLGDQIAIKRWREKKFWL